MTQPSAGSKVGERLAEAPAGEVTSFLYGPRMREELRASFDYLTQVNQAHVVMLAERGVLTAGAAAGLLEAIGRLAAAGRDGLHLDPEREDLYFNYEHAIIEHLGSHIGGQLHTGRSRNDLGATLTRLRCREVLLGLLDTVCACRQTLLDRAALHLETVMPGYTHLQPAQPITYAHWLAAIAGGLGRDTSRLLGALLRTELSPLGAAALAGTGFDIDRDRTAALLGFTGLIEDTLDAVASRDYLLETLAAGAITGTTLSRFAQDLYVWYTNEFALIDFPDRVAGTSSIMPQKRNPIVLEHIKGRTAHVVGALSSALSAVRSSNYTNVIDANREGFSPAWAALEELRITLVLARVAADTATPRAALMLARCRANFSTVTELADTLVRVWGISFRDAHEVVGAVVREAVAADLDAGGIDAALVRRQAAAVLGGQYAIDDETVRSALDPLTNVRARRHAGGPAPEAMKLTIAGAAGDLDEDRAAIAAARARHSQAQQQLAAAVARWSQPVAQDH